MTPDQFLKNIIDPALKTLADVGGPKVSNDARRELLAIAMQECGPNLNARYQNSPSTSPGPAHGWWQFEQGGGVKGVLNHSAVKDWASKLCSECAVVVQEAAVWRAIEGHDDLSTGFARLLLYTDPKPLPTTQQDGWDYYQRNWRPGKPHPENWAANWSAADKAVHEVAI